MASPYAYYKDFPASGGGVAAGPRKLGGGFWNQGPMDAATAAGKVWVVEDDTLTSFAAIQQPEATCGDAECDGDVLRRNVYASAMHGASLYFYDVAIQGWFGRPDSDPESPGGQVATDSMWRNVATAVREVLAAAPAAVGSRLAADVAVFVDDESLAFMSAPVGNENSNFHNELLPLLPYEIGAAGASVSFYMLSDLLLPTLDLSAIKLAVFANAFALSPAVEAAINSKLKSNDRTLVWVYAPAILGGPGDSSGGALRARELTGLPLVSRVGDAWPVKSKLHAEYFSSDVPLTFGPTGLRSPYLVVDKNSDPAYADVVEIGVYDWAGVDVVSCARRSIGAESSKWNSLFVGSPGLPAAAWRDVMVSAGVHLYLGPHAVDSGDWVEARGRAIMVVAGEGGGKKSRRVFLPAAVGLAAAVRDAETGKVVCTKCSDWNTRELKTGQLQLFMFYNENESSEQHASAAAIWPLCVGVSAGVVFVTCCICGLFFFTRRRRWKEEEKLRRRVM